MPACERSTAHQSRGLEVMDRIFFIVYAVCLTTIVFGATYAHADSHLTDIRCCVEPKRYTDGRIVRSATVIKEFERLYPLPVGADRSQYQINHSVPLVCGGKDIVSNLMWMRVEAKTCAEDWCQDRHEQVTMCPRSYRRGG